ncbi:MAG: metallophosphoesterase family protein [Bacteroidia bacterium]|nr:metallophosphoesterase family protein [Bacteroidia bacterium]
MKKILLLSDTHACSEPDITRHFINYDEIWHAGDWGNLTIYELMCIHGKPIKGVYGNIDGQEIRQIFPLNNYFECEGIKVYMTHIGGYPGKYNPKTLTELKKNTPDLFICGHSHILRVMRDPNLQNMLYMNPGAAGRHGFHNMRTMLKFNLDNGKISDVAVIELGKRTAGILPDLQ